MDTLSFSQDLFTFHLVVQARTWHPLTSATSPSHCTQGFQLCSQYAIASSVFRSRSRSWTWHSRFPPPKTTLCSIPATIRVHLKNPMWPYHLSTQNLHELEATRGIKSGLLAWPNQPLAPTSHIKLLNIAHTVQPLSCTMASAPAVPSTWDALSPFYSGRLLAGPL